MEWHHDGYTISTERGRLDLGVVHRFISEESYWGQGRSPEVVRKAVENSFPFGVYRGDEMVGFARVVTDYATFAWLADVFVLKEHRGRGLSKWLMEVILGHPELQGFRRWASGDEGRARALQEVRLPRPAPPRALDGATRPLDEGVARLLAAALKAGNFWRKATDAPLYLAFCQHESRKPSIPTRPAFCFPDRLR